MNERLWVSKPSWNCQWCWCWDWDAAGHTWRALAVPLAEQALFQSLAPRLSDGRQIRLNVAGLKRLACRTILTDLEAVVQIALAHSCLRHRSFARGPDCVPPTATEPVFDTANATHLGKKRKLCSIKDVDLYCLFTFFFVTKNPTWCTKHLVMLIFFLLKCVCW